MSQRMGNVQEVQNDSDFQKQLTSAGNKLVIVDFSTTWCPPSLMMEPLFQDLSEKYIEAIFIKADADICQETAERQQIHCYPTFVIMKNGLEIQRIEGADPEELEKKIAYLSDFPDSCVTTEALEHLKASNINVIEDTAPIWLEIATYMAIDEKYIDRILSQHSEAPQCFQAMLEYTRPATWRIFLNALRAHGKEEIALKIERSRESHPDVFQQFLHSPNMSASRQEHEGLPKSNLLKRSEEARPQAAPSVTPKGPLQSLQRECTIPGVEAVGSTTVWMVSGAKKDIFMKCGVRLQIPKEATPFDLPPTELQITPSLAGQYQFPDDCELVSGVYWITFPHKFLRPASLDIEHCVHLTHSSQCSSLSFVRAESTQEDLPYKFQLLDGGVFNPRKPCGTIEITEFSGLAVIFKKFIRHGARRVYASQFLYKKERALCKWMLYFVIIPNLAPTKTAVRKWYKEEEMEEGAQVLVEYEEEKIALDIPKDGHMEGKWLLEPLYCPQILRSSANAYRPGQQIPMCQVYLKWTDKRQQPTELKYPVKLVGARQPQNVVKVILDPVSQDPFNKIDGNPIVKDQGSPIRRSEHAGICMLLEQLSQSELERLGLNLGLSIQRLTGYCKYITTFQYTVNLVHDWTNRSDDVDKCGGATWLSLERVLRDLGQNGIANSVSKRAESHQISDMHQTSPQNDASHYPQAPHCPAQATCPIGPLHEDPKVPLCSAKDLEEVEPQLQHLMDLIAERIPNKWRLVGKNLGLDEADLSCIEEKNHTDEKECFHDIFTAWKKKMIKKYTWKTMFDILECPIVNEHQVAGEIKPKLRIMLTQPEETRPKHA